MKKVIIAMSCAMGIMLAANGAKAAIFTQELAQYDSYYVGSISPGIPSDPTDELGYINNLIGLSIPSTDTPSLIDSKYYNRFGSSISTSSLPAITGFHLYDKNESESNSWEISIDKPFYVLGKYDAENAGSLVWFVEKDFSGMIVLPTTFMGKEISHISIYATPIPGTLILFGSGLVGLAGIARRRFRE